MQASRLVSALAPSLGLPIRVPIAFSIGLLIALSSAFPASAQTAPPPTSAPLRLVVPLAPGGPSDQAARLLAKALSPLLGQDVVVENRPGGNGAVGAQALAAAPADGHTLLFAPAGMTGLPVLMKSPPFKSLNDFTPVAAVGGNQICLFVHPGLPVATTQEFVAHARAHPDELAYGSSSYGEYLAAAQVMHATGIRLTRIPYRGSVHMMPDLLEGRVQLSFMPPAFGAAHAKAGRLKLLGCNAAQRLPGLPDVPTLAEAGVSSGGIRPYHLLIGPAQMPAAVTARLATAIQRAANEPGVRAEFEKLLIAVEVLGPEQTAAAIRDGERVWAQFVRDADIKAE
jgi:tripartite-type tricarboxylate transporter receptor subunit TctC